MSLSLGWCAFGIIVCIFALIGLLPRFDSTAPGAWGDAVDDDGDTEK